ncbi:hypothetical protein BpHYR1_033080 [Brachionus plicatilis]|uniref:Protein-tyrosine sulfotransferase n=1 Tax=Brachionus plicatilis TaxID=10195 RepID=A0A3M7RI90_BRAPC|nr:hypothetical protein BpHYR1_033080 [Brachionus plicatilis]
MQLYYQQTYFFLSPSSSRKAFSSKNSNKGRLFDPEFVEQVLDKKILFIGGVGRSGTTLMRSILDTHSSINCGPESPFLSYFIRFYQSLKKDTTTLSKTIKRGYEPNFLNRAMAVFLIYSMENKNKVGDILCEKFPSIMSISYDLHKTLPNAKFIYMLRDGREVAYSFIKKLNKPPTFGINWNKQNKIYLNNCDKMGSKFCKKIRYKDLISSTKQTLEKICNFLEIEWTEKFLNHQNYIGSEVFAVNDEWSYRQIKKPINNGSFNSWMGKIEGYDQKFPYFQLYILVFQVPALNI